MSALFWLAAAKAASGKAVWGIFQPGTAGPFVGFFIFLALVYIMIQMARAGRPMREIHKLSGLDALDETIGRSTEMGRPVLFLPGITDVTDPQTIASYPILAYVAHDCARYDTRLIQANRQPVVYAVNETIIKESYLEAGRPDAFNPDDVRFISSYQFAFAGGVWQIMQRERPAGVVYFGHFYAETMMLVEMGMIIESVQIGACADVSQLPYFMVGCEYTLITEEMYVASAYISKEPVLTGTIVGEDIYKFIMTAVIIIGAIWASIAGHAGFTSFFKL